VKRYVDSILYQLGRTHGQEIVYKQVIEAGVDLESGATTQSTTDYTVSHAIVMTIAKIRQNELSGLSPNFKYGATWDESVRVVIIRANNLPSDFKPTLDDYVVFEELTWQVISANLLVENAGFAVVVKQVDRR
jgi:hypothetical protein